MRYVLYLIVVLALSPALAGSYDDFFRAVVSDNPQALRALVARGVDPNTVDEKGQPGLARALMADAFGAALELARMPGTDVTQRNRHGETALMLAALKDRRDVCAVLLERGAPADPDGWTPLHYAASGNSLAVVEMLLARSVRVDPRAPNGRTPLMLAALHGGEPVVEALLAGGADAGALDRRDVSAADLARQSGREWLAKRLEAAAQRGSAH